MWEKVFGPSEEKAKFEQAMQDYKKKESSAKFGRGRLGVDYQAVVTNPTDGVFVGQFYAGGQKQMNAIFDSTTNFIAVQGEGCVGCEGEEYNITNRVDAGTAELKEIVPRPTTYGGYTLEGKTAVDKLCPSLNRCADVEFLYVTKSTDDSSENIYGT